MAARLAAGDPGEPCDESPPPVDEMAMQWQTDPQEDEARQKQAEELFQKAVDLEQRGKVYDALPLYRKAVQLVPDIEFRFYETQKSQAPKKVDTPGPTTPATDDPTPVVNLFRKFQRDVMRDYGGTMIQSSRDPGVISTEMHISEMPAELVFYILRWVVSSHMDMRSLEQCAAVSKGMYLFARDEQIWHRACVKIWGANLGNLKKPFTAQPDATRPPDCNHTPVVYNTWRQMFIERERVHYNGCYYSKTSYLRVGHNAFQDQFYRPMQLVEYYRYIRFLPDGHVFMMTNADEPAQAVQKLRDINQMRPDVLRGHYRLYGNTVSIVLKKSQPAPRTHGVNNNVRQRRANSAQPDDANCTHYHIEFRIMPTTRRRYGQLAWLHYSIIQTRNTVESSTEFELLLSKYPPLRFAIVRSYHRDSEAPLD